MKKLTLLVVLLTVFSASSFATEIPISETSNFKMVAKSDVKYDLYYASEDEGSVKVCILDANGKKLNSCFVRKTKSFKRTYDFSQLKQGEYTIVVTNKDGKATQVIKHKVKAKLLQTFVAKLPDSKSLKLHVGSFNANESVKVRIYNEKSKLIHRDKIENDQSFSRVYNLEDIHANNVRVVIENNGEIQTFTHDLR